MYKNNGTLIYQGQDDDGLLEVVDTYGERALHFGTNYKQSAMLLADPLFLQLRYSRAMMAGLLFSQSLRRSMLVGLGGGSLAKFLLHYYPVLNIDVIECRSGVIEVARRFFDLPSDPRLNVIVGEGGALIKQYANEPGRYDLLVVDAFDHAAVASTVISHNFFEACYRMLSPEGIMVINLWKTDAKLFKQAVNFLSDTFKGRLLGLPVRDRGNIIYFGFPGRLPKIKLKDMQARAERFEMIYGLEFPLFLRDFKRHNLSFIENLIN